MCLFTSQLLYSDEVPLRTTGRPAGTCPGLQRKIATKASWNKFKIRSDCTGNQLTM